MLTCNSQQQEPEMGEMMMMNNNHTVQGAAQQSFDPLSQAAAHIAAEQRAMQQDHTDANAGLAASIPEQKESERIDLENPENSVCVSKNQRIGLPFRILIFLLRTQDMDGFSDKAWKSWYTFEDRDISVANRELIKAKVRAIWVDENNNYVAEASAGGVGGTAVDKRAFGAASKVQPQAPLH